MDELPLEVVEKILEKLKLGDTDVDDDRKTMLNVRLINSRWRDGMENVMEQKCLASWTKWKVVRYHNLLPQLFKWVRMYGSEHVCIPEAMEKLIDGNPFISRSIYTDDSREHDETGWKIITSEKFFTEWSHGQTVTNFKTHNSLPPKEMYEVLKLLPNLKAFGAPIDIQKDEETFIKTQSLPPLPNLKILELWCPKPENQYRDYFRWFLNAYGGQVVHLKLAAESLPALRSKNKVSGSVVPKMYQNLQRLKVYMPGGTFFRKTEANIPLTHLSIEHYEKPMSLKGIKVITDFIDKFAKTVVKLHLDVELGDITLDTCDVPAPPQIKFPRLTGFSYNLPLNGHETAILKSWFLERFPELKTLQMLRHHNTIQEILVGLGCNPAGNMEGDLRRYFQRKGYWTAAPKLEKISLITCQENGDQELLEIYKPGFQWPSYINGIGKIEILTHVSFI